MNKIRNQKKIKRGLFTLSALWCECEGVCLPRVVVGGTIDEWKLQCCNYNLSLFDIITKDQQPLLIFFTAWRDIILQIFLRQTLSFLCNRNHATFFLSPPASESKLNTTTAQTRVTQERPNDKQSDPAEEKKWRSSSFPLSLPEKLATGIFSFSPHRDRKCHVCWKWTWLSCIPLAGSLRCVCRHSHALGVYSCLLIVQISLQTYLPETKGSSWRRRHYDQQQS